MNVLGLMSGTSADGIDAALCEITGAPPHLNARIIAAETFPYAADTRTRILEMVQPGVSRVDELSVLNFDLAEEFAKAALHIMAQAGLSPAQVDLISSHGQTVWHNVTESGAVNATLQIGEAAVIAERTGVTTISNFRPRDVAAGGQGAPMVAYVDWLLLRHTTEWRAIQNIGGTANVTLLPPQSDANSQPLAFDTGPGNVLIDAAITRLTNGEQHYDADGAMAARGKVDAAWLTEMLMQAYFHRRPPKTTGRELFGTQMALSFLAEGRSRGLAAEDIIATITALTAHSIADAVKRYAPQPIADVIVGGGGRLNSTLMRMLHKQLDPIQLLTHEDIGLSSKHKEALAFAVLAYETWHNRIGTMPALTGARHASVLGQITPGANYIQLIQQTWDNT